MVKKKENNINVEDITRSSQYDGMLVLRDIHDLPGHSIRTRDAQSVVPQYYTHFDVSYNGNGQPTEVVYYAGLTSEITQIGVKPASTLNNKYFFLFDGRSNKPFYVWFNVDGGGTDPAISNSTGIEISVSALDPAVVVAMSIELALGSATYCDKWKVVRRNAVLEIISFKLGESTPATDGDTTFIFSVEQSGEQQEVSRIEIDYSNNGDPIYEGSVLRGHTYNIFTGKFDKNEVEVTLINDFATSVLVYDEANGVAISATATIITYVVPVNTIAKLKRVNLFGDCMGTYTVKVNGSIIDKTGTYYTHYKDTIVFDEIEYVAGDIVTIEVTNRGTGAGDFNANLQGRLIDV